MYSPTPEDRATLLAFERLAEQTREPETLFELALELAVRTTEAERGFLVRVARAGSRPGSPTPTSESLSLVFQATRNFDREEVRRPELKVSTSLIRTAADSGEVLRAAEASEDPRFESARSIQELDLRSVLVLPVRYDARIAGVLYLDNRFVRGLFGEREEFLVGSMAGRLGEALVLAAQREALRATLGGLEDAERADGPLPRLGKLVGSSPAMQAVYELLRKAAASDVPVLITGESGTGKELAARTLHFQGPRASRPFVAESCAALPDTLIETELFGHARGAFTGAEHDKPGLFELAHGGTLFLDEIGDAGHEVQRKLLRVLEDHQVRPVGAQQARTVDVRPVFATNRDLDKAKAQGRFLPDLYYRIAVIQIPMPALRERLEDVEALAAAFLEGSGSKLEKAALDKLRAYPWPGNVRELSNVLARARVLADGDDIHEEHIVLDPARAAGAAVPAAPASVSEIRARQARFLASIQPGETLCSQDYADRVDVSKRTAIRDLNELVDAGLLERFGERRAARYRRRS